MCRMLYLETKEPTPTAWKVVEHALVTWGEQNKDGSGVAWADHSRIRSVRVAAKPDELFKTLRSSRDGRLPRSKRLLGHVRWATSAVKLENTHPFRSCDGLSVLTHNGVLGGLEEIRTELRTSHAIQGDTDSEVILHLLEKHGPEKAMKELRQRGVQGSANWIWVTPQVTYAYSDGSLVLVQDKTTIGLFSDLKPFGSLNGSKPMDLPYGTLVTIKNGRVRMKKIATIPQFSAPSEPVVPTEMSKDVASSGPLDRWVRMREKAQKALETHFPPTRMGSGDAVWACKTCNTVMDELPKDRAGLSIFKCPKCKGRLTKMTMEYVQGSEEDILCRTCGLYSECAIPQKGMVLKCPRYVPEPQEEWSDE